MSRHGERGGVWFGFGGNKLALPPSRRGAHPPLPAAAMEKQWRQKERNASGSAARILRPGMPVRQRLSLVPIHLTCADSPFVAMLTCMITCMQPHTVMEPHKTRRSNNTSRHAPGSLPDPLQLPASPVSAAPLQHDIAEQAWQRRDRKPAYDAKQPCRGKVACNPASHALGSLPEPLQSPASLVSQSSLFTSASSARVGSEGPRGGSAALADCGERGVGGSVSNGRCYDNNTNREIV